MVCRKNSGRVNAISAAIRGGNFNNVANAGVFALHLNNSPDNSNYNISFRACKRLRQKEQARTIFPVLRAFLLGALILAGQLSAKHKKRERGVSRNPNILRSNPGANLKSFANLYPKIYDFKNLHLAYLKARKNKRYKNEVLEFSANLEENLITLQNELIWKTYKTSPYKWFTVYEPKERLIMALPFKDRVIHHALCNIIEPIFERSFISDSFACRKGKGVHKASQKLTMFLRRARKQWGDSIYCLAIDVQKFFPSVDHHILASILREKITCPDTLWLIEEILFSAGDKSDPKSSGLPIGNLTSQLWANVYLNEIDHFTKETLRIKFYIRYMDDLVILESDKHKLARIKEQITDFMKARLLLKPNNRTVIFPARLGIDFIGYRTWPDYKLLRKSSIKRARRRLRKQATLVASGSLSEERFKSSVASWIGYCSHADAYRIKNKLLEKIASWRNRNGTDNRTNGRKSFSCRSQTGQNI